MGLFPTFHEWAINEVKKAKNSKKAKSPNYSFDSFVKSAEKLKGDVYSLVGDARQREEEINRKAKKAKEKPPETYDDPSEDNSEKAWKQLRKTHKDKAPNFEKKKSETEDKEDKKEK